MKKRNAKRLLFWMLTSIVLGLLATGGAACADLAPLEPADKSTSAIMAGDPCDCSNEGKDVYSTEGNIVKLVGMCINSAVLSKTDAESTKCNHGFIYTICPDPRTFANCPDGGVGGTGGTGGSAGTAGTAGNAGTAGTAGTGGTGVDCTPGQQTACTDCANGGVGFHICAADGKSYGPCQNCIVETGGAGGTAGTAGNAGTAGSGGTACECVPGAQVDCACGGTVIGFQVCKSDCSGFDPCECPDGGVGGTGGTGGSAGTAGTAGNAGTAGTGGTGVNCIPGQQVECACGGGIKGFQVCKDDGSGYDTCQGCGGTGGAGGTGGSAGAAGTGGAPPLCVPGQQIICACGGGVNGFQVCKADGMSYDPCVCPDAGTGGSAGTAGAAGNAGTAGTGGSATLCTPGSQIPCACGGNNTGTQTCAADGMSYGSCQCTILACHDGEYCTGTGYSFAPCEVCHEIVNGADRYVSCQQGFMVLDSINFDPSCHPDGGVVANDCEALGVPGKIAVIIDVDPAYTPPANQVLGVFGKSAWYIQDAGVDKPYEVWGQAQQTSDKHLMVLPLDAVAGVSFQFEAGYAPAGNTDISNWNYRCTASACPSADKYTVCIGKTLLDVFVGGSFKTGKCHGANGPWEWETLCIY